MKGAARKFFVLALLYAICGMALGLYMGLSQDHSQMPVHAHAMVLGWLMSGFFAFFYHLFPDIGRSPLATAHFWLTAASGIILLLALFMLFSGNVAMEPVAGISSIAFFACFLLFVWIARPAFSRA